MARSLGWQGRARSVTALGGEVSWSSFKSSQVKSCQVKRQVKFWRFRNTDTHSQSYIYDTWGGSLTNLIKPGRVQARGPQLRGVFLLEVPRTELSAYSVRWIVQWARFGGVGGAGAGAGNAAVGVCRGT